MPTFDVHFKISVKDDQATETEQTILDAVNSSPLRPLAQSWSVNKDRTAPTYRGYPTAIFNAGVED